MFLCADVGYRLTELDFCPRPGEPGLLEKERLPVIEGIQQSPIVIRLGHRWASFDAMIRSSTRPLAKRQVRAFRRHLGVEHSF